MRIERCSHFGWLFFGERSGWKSREAAWLIRWNLRTRKNRWRLVMILSEPGPCVGRKPSREIVWVDLRDQKILEAEQRLKMHPEFVYGCAGLDAIDERKIIPIAHHVRATHYPAVGVLDAELRSKKRDDVCFKHFYRSWPHRPRQRYWVFDPP